MANANSPTLQMVQDALRNADAVSQGTATSVTAMADAIQALLLQPDSGQMRKAVSVLCDQIKRSVHDACDELNANAEQLGCNYIDERARAASRRLYDAAKASIPH